MSRHAATTVRRDRRSSRATPSSRATGTAPAHVGTAPAHVGTAPAQASARSGAPITAAELIARHRAATPAHPVRVAAASARPLTAAELIARHRGVDAAPPTRRRNVTQPLRAASRLPALVRRDPIKVVARPLLVAVAVLATVAGIEAAHLPASKASADQSAATVALTTSAAATSGTASSASASTPRTTSVTTAESMSVSSTLRVSRAKRDPAPQILTKPGQTVAGVWVKPNQGPMTSCFCMRWGAMHWGIDLAGPLGSPILAVGDGVVLEAGPAEGYGNWVVIQHSNGDVSIYGHMRYYFVHAGQKVTAGEKIALVGDEGQSTGPHLHFEIHKGGLNGVKIDPVPWLRARGISVGPYDPNG